MMASRDDTTFDSTVLYGGTHDSDPIVEDVVQSRLPTWGGTIMLRRIGSPGPPATSTPAPDVSVIVPVFNNAATLSELVDRLVVVLEGCADPFEIIFVDDGSRDESLALLRARAVHDPRLRVFALTRNFGSQAASCAACDQVRGRRVVHIDADLENLPEDIPKLLAMMDQGYDLVCGYRETSANRSRLRRWSSFVINIYVRRETGTDIRDVGCGLRAMDAALVRDLASEGEARRLMTPVLLRRARRIGQVPVRHRAKADPTGQSFRWVLEIALDYFLLTARRPFLIGLIGAAVTLLVGIVTIVSGAGRPGWMLLSIGVLGLLVSLAGEYAQRTYQLLQGLPFYQLRDLPHRDAETLTGEIADPSGSRL